MTDFEKQVEALDKQLAYIGLTGDTEWLFNNTFDTEFIPVLTNNISFVVETDKVPLQDAHV